MTQEIRGRGNSLFNVMEGWESKDIRHETSEEDRGTFQGHQELLYLLGISFYKVLDIGENACKKCLFHKSPT